MSSQLRLKSTMIRDAIRSEETYNEGRKKDWKFTKFVAKRLHEELLPEGATVYLSNNSITIRVPWGIENLQAGRQAMGKKWRFSSNHTDNGGTLTKAYYITNTDIDPNGYFFPIDEYRSVWLNLVMDAGKLDPGTCRRIEVGEKTYTQKVYQVICDEGMSEMLGKAEELE